MRVAILDDYFDTLRGLPSFRKLDEHSVEVWNRHATDEELVAGLAETEVLVLFRERTAIDRELLDQLPNLKLISMRGDYPHVDVDACTENGIMLSSNVGGGSTSHPTAELTWALILASMRQLPQQVESLRAGAWQMGVGRTLKGRTLGLYGYGRIAKTVSNYAAAFGMEVQWWGSTDGRLRAEEDGVSVADHREAFFAESDIVSVHVRLRSATRGIITAQDFEWMSPTSLFVNTSRAAAIESGALLEALELGRPGSAAVDVFDSEPVEVGTDPLVIHPHVIATPHIGFVTEDELDRQFSDIYDQIVAYADGQPTNIVNPPALA